MPTPLRKETPSEIRVTIRLTAYELASLERRAGVKAGSGGQDGRAWLDFLRGLWGLPERRPRARASSARAGKG